MKFALALLALGVVALIVQGGLATFLPPPYCPDFALLIVVSIGLLWDRPVSGMLLATVLGFSADLLSGSLFGQHALLRLLVFAGARIASRRVNIRGVFPLACFAAGLTVLYHLGLFMVSGFFVGASSQTLSWWLGVLWQAVMNGIFAAPALALVERVIYRLDEVDSGHRSLPLQPRERRI